MNSVYKEPNIYKQGISIKDVSDSIKWENVEPSKLGTYPSYLSDGNVTFKVCKTLKLIMISAWQQYSAYQSGSVTVFNFNLDIPTVPFSSYTGPCLYYDANNILRTAICRIFPSGSGVFSYKITVSLSGSDTTNEVTIGAVILPILNNDFFDYLGI